jgi:Sec-independent protein translocase protein TatA
MQIKTLMEGRQAEPAAAPAKAALAAVSQPGASAHRPALPPEVSQVFLPVRGRQPEGAQLLYRPFLLGTAKVQLVDTRKDVDLMEDLKQLIPITEEAVAVKWDEAVEANIEESELLKEGEPGALFAQAPAAAGQAKSYTAWKKDFADETYRNHKLELLKSPSLGEISKPNESERDFRIRLTQLGREQRDEWMEKLRENYARKTAALEEKIRRAEERLQREQAQAQQQKLQTAISIGSTLLGAFLGRKAVSRSTVGRATTAMRGAGRAMREAKDVARAEDNLEVLQQQLADLEAEFKSEAEAYAASHDPQSEKLETIAVRPKKTNISVQLLALAWVPHWLLADGSAQEAWQ